MSTGLIQTLDTLHEYITLEKLSDCLMLYISYTYLQLYIVILNLAIIFQANFIYCNYYGTSYSAASHSEKLDYTLYM